MVSQGQLNSLPILKAFNHFFNHPVRQCQTNGGWHRVLGGMLRAPKGYARCRDYEGRHFLKVRMPENLKRSDVVEVSSLVEILQVRVPGHDKGPNAISTA
jgi:hypothetical protein